MYKYSIANEANIILSVEYNAKGRKQDIEKSLLPIKPKSAVCSQWLSLSVLIFPQLHMKQS